VIDDVARLLRRDRYYAGQIGAMIERFGGDNEFLVEFGTRGLINVTGSASAVS
jgi:hypothetical protein